MVTQADAYSNKFILDAGLVCVKSAIGSRVTRILGNAENSGVPREQSSAENCHVGYISTNNGSFVSMLWGTGVGPVRHVEFSKSARNRSEGW